MNDKPNIKGNKATHYAARDEVYHVNGVAYLEGNFKLIHLRILMAIIRCLQTSIHFKISHRYRSNKIPEIILPAVLVQEEKIMSEQIRIITIPVAEFHLGINNGSRLRAYLEELRHLKCNFPDKNIKSSSGLRIANSFNGLIFDYSFPAYSTSVEIHLLEEMVGRLLLTEEGYSYYSYKSALSITNKYTLRIYWLICSWRTKGGFVITLDNFKLMLNLGKAYDRYDNIVTRILNPARQKLRDKSPIWFLYKRYDNDGVQRIAFKIKLTLTEAEQQQMKDKARDICFNILVSSGAKYHTVDEIFNMVESEDLKPFIAKLASISAFIHEHPYIRDKDSYIRTSMEQWFSDWTIRYPEITD